MDQSGYCQNVKINQILKTISSVETKAKDTPQKVGLNNKEITIDSQEENLSHDGKSNP